MLNSVNSTDRLEGGPGPVGGDGPLAASGLDATAPVHAEHAALAQYRAGELGGNELAALFGVDDLG